MEIEKVDLHNSCRGCLSSGDDLESIFECFYNDIPLSQILMNCIPVFISENDGLSAKLCELCRAKATESHEFQQMFINSEREMRDLLDSQTTEDDLNEFHVKQEDVEDAEADSMMSESNFEHIMVEQVAYNDSEDEKPLENVSKKRKINIMLEDVDNEEIVEEVEEVEYAEDEDFKTPSYKKKTTPRRHNTKASESTETFQCPDCSKQFNFEKTLKRHSVIHSDIMLKSKLDRSPTDFFTCVICSVGIETYNQLFVHMRNEHRFPADHQFECIMCNKTYVGMKSMIRHAKMHEENATHECIVCSKRLGMGDDLIDHMLRHEGYKPFKCTRCEKTFLKQNKLQAHILSHLRKVAQNNSQEVVVTNETELGLLPLPLHLCPECGNEFATKECLKRHLIRHTGIKNFACQHCPSKFFLKSGLTNHMFVHTKLKTHPCDYEGCSKAFTNSQCLKKHKRTHTGERPFACEVCNKRFQVAYHLRRHFLIHTGEKPYSCKYCDRAYSQSNDLVKHTKTHIGENTYKCNQCDLMFPKYGLLKEHEFTHFNNTEYAE